MNDNETVEQVCREISCSHKGMIGIEFGCVANRIFAAHKREIADFQRRYDECERRFNEADLERVRLRDEIAAKNEEIEKLKFEIMTLKSERRAAGEVIKEKTNKVEAKDAEIASLKSKIDEYERQPELMADTATKALALLKRQDAEIASLRKLVGELAVVLEKIDDMCDGDMCKHFINTKDCSICKYVEQCQTGIAHNALKYNEREIAKAREVAK